MARQVQTTMRDAEAATLRTKSWSYQQIGDHFGVSRQAAFQMVHRAMRDIITEPAEEARQFELDKLDALERSVHEALGRKHYVISGGKIVSDGEAKLEDDGFVLAAADRLVKISESRRKLLGLDAAQKLAVTGGVTYQLVGVDPDDV